MAKGKKAKTQNDEALREQLARALADYDNLQKRIIREREAENSRQKVLVITELLPVFDMLENVQSHLRDSGLALALDELYKAFKGLGLEVIKPKGHKFDENLHEAIDTREGKNEGEILECSLTGYRIGDYIIRPAKVVVSVKKKGKEKHE